MHSLKAIIFDDDPMTLSIMRRILERRGYEVQAYDNPADSPFYNCKECPCSLHDSKCPDLIISDYNMPVVNGAELLESTINKGCRCRHLALMSAMGATEEDLIRVEKYGTYYFTKPIDLAKFYKWLDQVEKAIAARSSA